MAWNNRQGVKFLLVTLLCQLIQGLEFLCSKTTCMLENLDLNEDHTFAFAYPINTTSDLTAMFVKGDVFDLTTLPNLSNLRHFVLDHSQLDSVIVTLTAEGSTVSITNTPLRTIIFHNSRNLEDVRIESSLLATIPDTVLVQELLKVLFITHSQLAVINFELFEKLANLQYVDFSFNKLHVVHIPSASTCCHRLITLDLQENRLEHFNFGLISHMNCLETLTLKRNRLVKIENSEPNGKPQNLPQYCTTLKRSPTVKHEDQDTESYSHYASLTVIILADNRLVEVNLSMFVNMPNLKDLLIGRNLLSSISVTDGQLPMRLKWLDLSFNRLANADLKPISIVKTINIAGNK